MSSFSGKGAFMVVRHQPGTGLDQCLNIPFARMLDICRFREFAARIGNERDTPGPSSFHNPMYFQAFGINFQALSVVRG